MMKRIFPGLVALALTLASGEQAGAGMLLDLQNPPGQTDSPISLPFVAGSDSTTISFAGFQVSGALQLTNIELTLTGGGPNLLGGSWTLTPAPFGSFASEFDDGTGVPALFFGAFVEGSFDVFSQAVSTVIGQSYTLSFLLSNTIGASGPSELIVATDDAVAPVPLPSTVVMSSILFGACGVVWTCRRLKRGVPATMC